ncbi:unnamed protein product [Lactuca saligna]|uniref:Uncharacterized protein n=1 Tax=Lactuca saligna TaxID=75948 RepID=A0AA36A410_LACSI|nr:unnamed protein product [Lactuca saligna]
MPHSKYWLDRIASLDHQNSQDSQIEPPITPKAFRFHAFVKVANSPFTDSGADQLLFSFYLKHMKPRYETWSAHKIVVVKVTRPIETESFPSVKFKVVRDVDEREKEKSEPVMSYLQLMLNSYIQEVGLMDVDIVAVLKKKPTVVPKEALKDFEKLKPGKIYDDGWFVVYQSRE